MDEFLDSQVPPDSSERKVEDDLIPIPVTLSRGIMKHKGFLVLAPGTLYFICSSAEDHLRDLMSGWHGNADLAPFAIVGDMLGPAADAVSPLESGGSPKLSDSINQNTSEVAALKNIEKLEELIRTIPKCFRADSNEIQFLRKEFLSGFFIKLRDTKFHLWRGISKKYHPALKKWCDAHGVSNKGFG